MLASSQVLGGTLDLVTKIFKGPVPVQFWFFFFPPKIKTWFQFSHFILGAVFVLDLTVLVPILELQNSKNSEKLPRFCFENKKPQKIWKFWNTIQKIKIESQ
jgi:hypothetical protein